MSSCDDEDLFSGSIRITDRTQIRAILAYNNANYKPTWAIRTDRGTACMLLEVEPGMMNNPNAIIKIANGDVESVPLNTLHLRGKE